MTGQRFEYGDRRTAVAEIHPPPQNQSSGNGQRIFMVVPSTVRECKDKVSYFVEIQARLLRISGWNVTLGVVDDRTSVSGILRNITRLRQEVDEAKATIVHAQYGTVTAAIAHWIRNNRPLAVSFTGEDLLGTRESSLQWWVREKAGRQISLFSARHADAITVKSDNLRRALPERLRRKCIVLPDGVDMSFFAPMDRAEVRSRLGWGHEPVVLFVSAGGNRRVKNLPLAEASIQNLRRRGHGAKLVVVSAATRQEVLWMLNAADILLVTSVHEGSPNIVKEAMACNLPVVSVPCGDVADRLVDVTPGGIASYNAHRLGAMMADVLSAGSRSNGRKQLNRQGLTANFIAQSLGRLYLSIASGHKYEWE